uniref:Uncharacterized protein n=2 Tax=Clytia hemisphaerica TaxID=252671 RepID=A0A7M5WZR7_9CNID
MFRESSDPEWNRMYHFMKSYNFKDTNQAIEDLKSGRLNAVIHDYPVLFHFLSKDPGCKIRFAGEPIKDAGYGLAVKKGNPLRDRLSELIIHYQDTGTITFLKNRWMSSKCEDSLNIQMSAQQMGTTFFGGLFLFVGSGICLSVCLFLTECISAAGKRSRGKDTLSGPRTIINHNIINRTLTSIPEESFKGDEDGLAPRSLALDHFRKAVNKEMKSRQEDGHLVLGNSLAEGNINHSFIIE